MRSVRKDALDFIVIGAQKSGTTSLFEYLRRHPEIHVPPGKEAPYFSHEAARARGWHDYLRKTFAFAEPNRKWGTVTTHYMFGAIYEAADKPVMTCGYDEHTVPLRIRERLPNVRLIAILRDPVQRAMSHHLMTRMNQLEHRSFDEAIEELLRPASLQTNRKYPNERTGYVVLGEYGRILRGYFDVFAREQILVVFTHDLERAPQQTLRRVQQFIGVSPGFTPENLGVRYREGSSSRPTRAGNLHAIQQAVATNVATRTLWHAMPEVARRRVDRLFAQAAYWADLHNRHDKTARYNPTTATIARLREHFAADEAHLTELLREELPWRDCATA